MPGLRIQKTKMKLRSFTGQELKVLGEAAVTVKHAGQGEQVRVIVCDQPSRMPLMGREWLRKIRVDWKEVWMLNQQKNRRTLQAVLTANKEVFEAGLGEMTVEAHLTLKPEATPRTVPARPIPYALLPKVNEELDRWVDEEIAEKVEPSEKTSGWGTPLVPVPKPSGDVRLCASYDVTVNPQLVVKQHPLPRAEDVFAGVDGKLFCKLDLKKSLPANETGQRISRDDNGQHTSRIIPDAETTVRNRELWGALPGRDGANPRRCGGLQSVSRRLVGVWKRYSRAAPKTGHRIEETQGARTSTVQGQVPVHGERSGVPGVEDQ